MAPSSSKDPHDEAAENALPPAVIAQAQAAILGQFENGIPPAESRRPSHSKPNSSKERSNDKPSAIADSSKPNSSHLEVPDDSLGASPAYGNNQIELSQDGFDTKAKVTDDGRVNININQKTRKLSDLLVPALRNQLSLVAQEQESAPLPPGYLPPALGGLPGQIRPPRLSVVIHVVGSRGDVQPFVALGKTLKSTYGHRVRLATHPTFQGFVEENGLEFFSIGGDPSELMAFMVKNPGLMPGIDSLRSGDVGKRRKGIEEILLGCWRSCIEGGDGLGAPPRRDSTDSFLSYDSGINMNASPSERPFIADAIIANPPSFAHVHIAEKMGIPLHMMFTMPWSPTQAFPHPLANIQSSNADVTMTNFVSYALVEMMTWQGLGDVINRFRERALGLDPISLIWAPGILSRLRVPYTYCWSPALIPKPKDWGKHISISGFYFLSLASSFTPEPELAAFLRDGPPPVYIGFGSIVIDDPDALTKIIFEAVKKTGCRALVSKGWGGLGADAVGIPEGVFMLGNVPHDWLFQHVSCVVHHGGAGTTAAGISTGKPTIVVPFFGDQPFWGAMVARAGAGPMPIPFKQLTADNLAAALTEALKPETLAKAKELGARIKEEKGTEVGGKSFHDMLDVDNMRCSVDPNRVAVWRVKRTQTRLSALAANVLSSEGLLDFADLKLYRPREYMTEDGPWDPISGGASALLGTIASLTMGVADFPIEIFKAVKGKKEVHAALKEKTKDGSGSGSNTPTNTSRSQLQPDLQQEETAEPNSCGVVESTSQQALASTTSSSARPSYEDTDHSYSNAPTAISPVTSTDSVGERRVNSLRQALRGTLSTSGSRSSSRERSTGSRSNSRDRGAGSRGSSPVGRQRREFDPSKLTIENAVGATKGVSRIVGAGIKSPMDFTLGLARGFHNAPKLYGDDTVRPQERVVDLQSGLKAAGKEFGYGFYDGISGLITQPIRGAEKEGAAGLIKGIGKGIGGLILKPGAAIWGLPGYTFMGIHKEVRKLFGSSILNYVISARTAQGFEDSKKASLAERQSIIKHWHDHKAEYQSAKQKLQEQGGPDGQETGHLSPRGFLQTRHLSFDERKRLHEERKTTRTVERSKTQSEHSHRFCPLCRKDKPHNHTRNASRSSLGETPSDDSQLEFEHAIHTSVEATSRGDLEEDLMIERAIRASVRELQSVHGSTISDQEALDRAIKASIAEAGRPPLHEDAGVMTTSYEEAEHEALLEKAIQESLLHYRISSQVREPGGYEVDTDEDEDVKAAIQKSKGEQMKSSNEEDIVLEYMKKQSLVEEKHKEAAMGKKTMTPLTDADEEALKQAIEESLKIVPGSTSAS